MTNKTKWIIGISVGILLLANVAGFLAGVAKQKAKDAEITKLKTENQVLTPFILVMVRLLPDRSSELQI
jgi:hypothetical protein